MSADTAVELSGLPSNLQPGQKLAGCYLLQREVKGGIRPLWLAHDEVLGKDIALQFLPLATLREKGAVDRLRQEVKRSRQLIHPKILRVYDFVEEEDWAAIAMDTFAGQPLSAVIALNSRGFFEPADVGPLLRDLCATLDEAHRVRVAHGALTPNEVIVGEGQLKLMNFGTAPCLFELEGSDAAKSTLSPQQIGGAKPTPRDDVYSVGVLLHGLLAGGAPHVDSEKKLSVSAHRKELGHPGEVPPAWEKVIAQCLSEDPEARPENCGQIVKLIEEAEASPGEANAAAAVASAPSLEATEAAAVAAAAAVAGSAATAAPAAAPTVEAAAPSSPVEEAATPATPGSEGAAEAAQEAAATAAPAEMPAAEVPAEKEAVAPEAAAASAAPSEAAPEPVAKSETAESVAAPAESEVPAPEAAPAPAVVESKVAEEPGRAESVEPAKTESEKTAETPSAEKAEAPAPVESAATAAPSSAAPSTESAAESASSEPDKSADTAAANEKRGRARTVRPTGVPGGATAGAAAAAGAAGAKGAPVDPDELAEMVRREEAAEDAKAASPKGDSFYPRESSGGPSGMAIAATAAVIAVSGFLIYRTFFGGSESERRPGTSTATAEATPALSTPEPVPTPQVVEASTPAPAPEPEPGPAPSTPGAIAMATPAPDAPPEMVANTPKTDATSTDAAPATPAPAPTTPAPTPVAESPKEIEAALAEIKSTVEKTTKELPSVRKATLELEARQKKLDAELKKAETAAAEAEKAASERRRLADDAKKAAAEAAELLAAKKEEIAKQEEAIEKLKAEAQAREKALAEAKKAAEEAAKRAAAEPMPATPGPSDAPALTLAPRTTPPPEVRPSPDDARNAFEQKMKELGSVLSGKPSTKAGESDPAASPAPGGPENATSASPAPAIELAKATTPAPEKAGSSGPSGDSFTNSLGMQFVPIPGGDGFISVWVTRVRDFEVFAKSAGLKSNLWKDPGFKQGPEHPVVNVSWQEAMAFCKWLTAREQKQGLISSKQSYRLPTDLEWSRAAGLDNEKGATPEQRDMGVSDLYPWGTTWPPPTAAGNYTGEETGSDVAIKGYNDGFAWTSPVGSFPANKYGLFDMGGNVWQWCMDSWNGESKAKVLRGASWYNGALKLSLLTSCRVHASPDSSTDNYGFRVVLSGEVSNTSKK